MGKMKIGVLVGSARRGAFSQKVADVFVSFLQEKYDVEFIKIDHLALYNQDYDDEMTTPENWVEFRKKIVEKEAYIFVTPEYNRSVPPILKNAIDIASRPYGQNGWAKKPAVIIGVTPGALGAYGSSNHLKQSLSFLELYVMPQPEAYLGNIAKSLDQDGNLTSKNTVSFIEKIANSYSEWVTIFKK